MDHLFLNCVTERDALGTIQMAKEEEECIVLEGDILGHIKQLMHLFLKNGFEVYYKE